MGRGRGRLAREGTVRDEYTCGGVGEGFLYQAIIAT